jgi:hypothetical protein
MKPIHLHFYHDKFDLLSDRSIRQFLKKIGTSVKDAQLSEIDDFIYSLDLDFRFKRSMQDRLRNQSQAVPAYYVEEIKKGSLTAHFVIGAALIGVLVFGPVMDILDDETKRRQILKRLRKFLKGDWARLSATAIADRLSAQELGNHIVVDEIKIKDNKARIDIRVKLKTMEDPDDLPRRSEYTPEMIDREIDRQIDETRKPSDGS